MARKSLLQITADTLSGKRAPTGYVRPSPPPPPPAPTQEGEVDEYGRSPHYPTEVVGNGREDG